MHDVERRRAMSGAAHSLAVPLAQYKRRGVQPGVYLQVRAGRVEHEFPFGEVFQLREADVDQQIYCLPQWMPAVQAALLNESPTLFRRKCYNHGSHADYILHLADAKAEGADVEALHDVLR